MDLPSIQTALAEIARPFADRRVQVFEVAFEAPVEDASALRLRGRVLEEAQRWLLQEELALRFPGLAVDVQAVEVLRGPGARSAVVGTNLTSVHDGPSFLAEQVTQMLNGAAVEVLHEEGRWGFTRQADGYLGWTYLPYLTELPVTDATHLVIAPVGLLRSAPEAAALLVTRVLGGTFVSANPSGAWARVTLAGGAQGWMPAEDLRALADLPGSPEARRAQLAHDAFSLIGIPYLWGGTSANGIDCSGFAQLLHRWLGIIIPRDADMQYAAGTPVEPPFAAGDLLFFGEKGEQRRITHVAVSLGGWQVIHSSRSRNGVQVDDVQAVAHLRDHYLCAAAYIGR
jgi:SH3-like domain-containing protein